VTSKYQLDSCEWVGTTPYTTESLIAVLPVFGRTLFIDHNVQSSELDEMLYHEHLVQPAMLALDGIKNKRVLVVGGGEGATCREVLRWPESSVSTVDWVDIDGDLVELCKTHLKYCDEEVYSDKRLTFKAEDCRKFFEDATNNKIKYDLIILDLCDPDVSELVELEEAEDHDTEAQATFTEEEGNMSYALHGPRFWEVLNSLLTECGGITTHTGPVFPGGLDKDVRPGQWWTRRMASKVGVTNAKGWCSKVCVPSFQGEWGFWMSVQPKLSADGGGELFPSGCRVMDMGVQDVAFKWPKYYGEGATL
jgi:predicted membrane-bound spermidine synthase